MEERKSNKFRNNHDKIRLDMIKLDIRINFSS